MGKVTAVASDEASINIVSEDQNHKEVVWDQAEFLGGIKKIVSFVF